MPDAQAAAPAANAANAGQGDGGTNYRRIFGMIQQVVLVYLASQAIGKYFKPSTPTTTDQAASPVTSNAIPSSVTADPNVLSLPPQVAQLSPVFPLGTLIDVHFCLSMSPHGDNCVKTAKSRGALPYFVWENVTFGDWKESRVVDLNVKIPPAVQRNTSLWADVLITHAGASPDPRDESFNRPKTVHLRKLMNRYLPKVKERKVKNLLGSKATDAPEEVEEPDVIVGHWHKNMTIALVSDATEIPLNNVPAPVAPYIHLEPIMRDPTGKIGYYKPILYPNEFWHLKEQYIEINSSTPELPLQVVFQPMSYFKFQMFASMTASFAQAAQQQGASTGAELDEVKRMLTETNPWFLALTAAVSVLHMLFEMLAFTNDVSHWRNKQELVGVSVRTIVTNVFVQIIILLYLIDNNENTSWMIILTSGMGVLIEAWKVTKAVNINIVAAPAGSLLPYKVQITDKHVLSEDEKKTQEYDKLAFRYVTYVTIPLLGGYTIYSLVYESHRGWYSFVISTLTSFVYMFGFAQLIPQLIINYKLKSVAHMPMKAMIYKTLSTVVDDFFAFCIKMPFLHRLACFRDDVVFCIFLYQRWIYRIDPKRVNEYGQVMASDVDAASAKEQKDPKDKAKLATKAKEKVE